METITVRVLANGTQRDVPLQKGRTLLAALRAAGVYLSSPCGGNGTCGKCRVRLLQGELPATGTDEHKLSAQDLAAGWRLACAAWPGADIVVELPEGEGERFTAVTDYAQSEDVDAFVPDPDAPPVYAVAVDVGTTTLGFALIDKNGGEVVRRLSLLNRQRQYGADVITRILRAGEGHLAAMRDMVRGQLAEGIRALALAEGIDAAAIDSVAVAGNTTMQHLLMGHSCTGLGVYPFAPVCITLQTLPATALPASGLKDGCPVYILPGISTYVGADIACGVLLTSIDRAEKPALLLDIGTNGEMALAADGRLLCTSTAAGPAFEGGNIGWGTGSIPGAISAVRWENGGFAIETIDGAAPIGICGSGVIDAVHACLAAGLVDETGRLDDDVAEEGVTLATTAEGKAIRFTQKDIREMQLAKSAIRSGVDVLMAHAGLSPEDVDALYLAGGFGYTISPQSAVGIGMLPAAFLGKTVAVGNTALGGAVAWLAGEGPRRRLEEIATEAIEYGLSEDPLFNQLFIENMTFEG